VCALPSIPSSGLPFFPLSTAPLRAFSLYHPPLPYPLADAPRLLTMNAVHPYSDAQALVYTPQYTDPTHHRTSFHQPISPSLWSPSTHALMSSSSADHARMYSLLHQPTIHNLPYTSPSPAVFYNHQPHNNAQQPRMQLSTPVPLNFSSPQIESSIGPHRGVLTRRQARAAQLRGTPQPSAGQQQEGAELTSPSETHDVRVFSSIPSP
jgi:hypothetical protein